MTSSYLNSFNGSHDGNLNIPRDGREPQTITSRERIARIMFTGRTKRSILNSLCVWLEENMPAKDVLQLMYPSYSRRGRKPNSVGALALTCWYNRMLASNDFTQAIEDWLEPSDNLLIASCREPKDLARAFRAILEADERQKEMKKDIWNELKSPFTNILMSFGLIYVLSSSLLKQLELMVPIAKWPSEALLLRDLGLIIGDIGIFIVPMLLGLVLLIALMLPLYTGPGRSIIDRMPILGLYRYYYGVVFLNSLTIMIGSGVTDVESLNRLKSYGPRWFRHRVETIHNSMLAASTFDEALDRSGHGFPDPEINSMMSAYIQTRGLADGLPVITKFWLQDQTENIQRQIGVAGTFAKLSFYGILLVTLYSMASVLQIALFEYL